MEANEALKSKFIYPDRLYARCKDNKTLDISYAPQNMEAVEYTRTDAFIEKACKYLQKEVLDDYPGVVWEGLIKEFKNYMKGE